MKRIISALAAVLVAIGAAVSLAGAASALQEPKPWVQLGEDSPNPQASIYVTSNGVVHVGTHYYHRACWGGTNPKFEYVTGCYVNPPYSGTLSGKYLHATKTGTVLGPASEATSLTLEADGALYAPATGMYLDDVGGTVLALRSASAQVPTEWEEFTLYT